MKITHPIAFGICLNLFFFAILLSSYSNISFLIIFASLLLFAILRHLNFIIEEKDTDFLKMIMILLTFQFSIYLFNFYSILNVAWTTILLLGVLADMSFLLRYIQSNYKVIVELIFSLFTFFIISAMIGGMTGLIYGSVGSLLTMFKHKIPMITLFFILIKLMSTFFVEVMGGFL